MAAFAAILQNTHPFCLPFPNLKKISIGIPAKEILKKFNNIVIPIFQSIEKNKDEDCKDADKSCDETRTECDLFVR